MQQIILYLVIAEIGLTFIMGFIMAFFQWRLITYMRQQYPELYEEANPTLPLKSLPIIFSGPSRFCKLMKSTEPTDDVILNTYRRRYQKCWALTGLGMLIAFVEMFVLRLLGWG